MADQAVISSLTSSMNYYNNQAASYASAASSAQATIDSLNPQLEHKIDQKNKVDAVSGRMGELDTADTTLDNDLKTVGTSITSATEDSGAEASVPKFNDENAGHISDAKSAASTLSQKLQEEIDSLRTQIANATSARDTANRNAASARSSAASCSAAIAREQAS